MSINKELIKQSYALAEPHLSTIIDEFYTNLFNDYPAEELFKNTNIEHQKTLLSSALNQIIKDIDNTTSLSIFLKNMGARHTKYGVEEEHYDWVGASLLKAFAEVLGDVWTDELNEQWALIYNFIAGSMIEGARDKLDENAEKEMISVEPTTSIVIDATEEKIDECEIDEEVEFEPKEMDDKEEDVFEEEKPTNVIQITTTSEEPSILTQNIKDNIRSIIREQLNEEVKKVAEDALAEYLADFHLDKLNIKFQKVV